MQHLQPDPAVERSRRSGRMNMLQLLFWVRIPTLLAIFWRKHLARNSRLPNESEMHVPSGVKCVRENSISEIPVGEHNDIRSRISPGGAKDLSPALQRWVEWKMRSSPVVGVPAKRRLCASWGGGGTTDVLTHTLQPGGTLAPQG